MLKGRFVKLERRTIPEGGLSYWVPIRVCVNEDTGEVVETDLDYHWQHRAAIQCMERFSREFNLPIEGKGI
jgi:hypothetical protein